jgi:hypothetical protein
VDFVVDVIGVELVDVQHAYVQQRLHDLVVIHA